MNITDEERIRLSKKIEELYFRKNFGSLSKVDIETLIFSEYIERCISHGEPYDDYSLSKTLGLTETRIRSLKERKELKYPHNEDPDWWISPFAQAVKNAKYDETDHYVKFIIQDVNVMNEVRHYIEESGWYDECSLNRKLLSIPLDCLADICVNDADVKALISEDVENQLKAIIADNKNCSEVESFMENFTKEGLKSFLMSASKEAIGLVLTALPFGGVANILFKNLANIVLNM